MQSPGLVLTGRLHLPKYQPLNRNIVIDVICAKFFIDCFNLWLKIKLCTVRRLLSWYTPFFSPFVLIRKRQRKETARRPEIRVWWDDKHLCSFKQAKIREKKLGKPCRYTWYSKNYLPTIQPSDPWEPHQDPVGMDFLWKGKTNSRSAHQCS